MLLYRGYLQGTLSLVMSVLVVNSSLAAEWDRAAGVAVGASYSDNICLDPGEEKAKEVLTAAPDVRLTGVGANASMDLLAALEFNSLADSSLDCNVVGTSKKSPSPRLRFSANSELIDQWFFFDASAYIDQNKADPFLTGGEDNLNGTGNTNTTYRYSLNPYISRRLTETSSVVLSYTFDEQINSEELVGDSQSDTVYFDVGTSPSLARWSFGLTGNYNEVRYEERRGGRPAYDSELSSAQARTSFQINSTWQVNGYAGLERNDFVSSFDEIDGDVWDAGVLWTPNTRISIAAGTGDRFFGDTPRFDINYRHKRSSFSAGYKKDLTYDRSLRGQDEFSGSIDEFVEIIDPVTGQVVGFAGAPTTITSSPILDERFTLGYIFNARRTRVNIDASHSEQTRVEDGIDAVFTLASVSLTRDLTSKLALNTRFNWTRREADVDSGKTVTDSDTWRLRVGFSRKMFQNTMVSLNYQYAQRESDIPQDDYIENRISLRFRYQF
jgi:uncharacterized protein (PEP-CTERM system associated)